MPGRHPKPFTTAVHPASCGDRQQWVESRHSFWKPRNCVVRWENEPPSRQRAAADGARE
jgi:hypothetical protein